MALPTELTYVSWLADEEKTRQENIVTARKYYDGDHDVKLTDRQKKFLGFQDSGRFALNYCATIANAVAERLIVAAFSSDDEKLAEWAWEIWQASRMDAKQLDVHLDTVIEGEHFVIVDWREGRPRFTPHPRYTDPQAGGTGFGCKVFYPDDDPNQPALYATKRWTERYTDQQGRSQTRQRMMVYYPDHVERYELKTTDQSGWMLLRDEGKPPEEQWQDKWGKPLGIPVIHFRNHRDRSELWDAVPPQDGINKTALDLLAAADAAGFPVHVAEGFTPTTDGRSPADDGSNYLPITPGCWIEIPSGAAAHNLEAGDLGQLRDTLDSLIIKLAQVTDTPISRFQLTGQIASEKTQKQQEGPLLSKVRTRQTLFGNGWENCFYVARRLANTFGNADLDEEPILSTQWKPAETRDEKEHIETIGLKVEKLAIPLEKAWAEAGYSQEEVDAMKATEEYQARIAGQQLAARGLGMLEEQGG